MVTYRVADMANGPFSEIFVSLDDAENYLQECVSEGFFLEKEAESDRISAGYAPRTDDEIMEYVNSFYYIVDVQEGM